MKYDIITSFGTRKAEALPFQGTNPKTGERLGVTGACFTRNGEPWFPVMGEFHFSRYACSLWEREILKIKAGGVSVIACYIFWIHHEEIENAYDWTGDRSLRQFLALCEKHEMKVFLRIGPWAHGEARNGGFPDWLLAKGFELRSDNPQYLSCVERFYGEIAAQAKDRFFKDGGCVIGVQIENEYGHCGGFRGEKGMAHMRTLKRIACEKGMIVPYYTATGWGGAMVAEGEMLPVLGAYADAPWDQQVEQLPANPVYVFSHLLNDDKIGSDQASDKKAEQFTFDPSRYPYLTAELGGGIQVTKHRRPIVTALDTQAMVFSRFASGAGLLGYYMYHGGTNPKGKLSTLEESYRTGGYSDLPILSYDFQAVIGEYGECHPSYRHLKILHSLISDFGSKIAGAQCYIPRESAKDPNDLESLRFSILKAPAMSLLCFSNYQRHLKLKDHIGIEMAVDGVQFPSFDLFEGECIAFPFAWQEASLTIAYATAQPLARIETDDSITLLFWNYRQSMIANIDGNEVAISQNDPLTLTPHGKKKVHMMLLSRVQAQNAWKVNLRGKEGLLITEAGVMNPDGKVICYGLQGSTPVWIYHDGVFDKEMIEPDVNYQETEIVPEKTGDNAYRFSLPKGWNEADEAFLCIDFEGNLANLYLGEERIADWFYTGLPWRVGLKKFAGRPLGDITLYIEPLKDDARIYLEKQPEYVDHAACRLNRIHLEYGCLKELKQI